MTHPLIQINHSRMLTSAEPNAVNELDPLVPTKLPGIVRDLLPVFFDWYCCDPFSATMLRELDAFDEESDALDFFDYNYRTLPHPCTVEIVDRWRALPKVRKVILTFRVLNAFGSIYGWVLHRVLREKRDNLHASDAKTLARIQRWQPAWPIEVATFDGLRPLHAAVRFSMPRLVAHLIEHGASVDTQDQHGTPLHCAAHGIVDPVTDEIVALLLNAGAAVDAPNAWRRTPLHEAVRRGNRSVARLLLAHGADPDALDLEGQRPRDKIDRFNDDSLQDSMEQVFVEHDARRLAETLSAALAPTPVRRRM